VTAEIRKRKPKWIQWSPFRTFRMEVEAVGGGPPDTQLTDGVHPGGEVTAIHSWRDFLTARRFGFKFQ